MSQDNLETWLKEAVHFYLSMGFLEEYQMDTFEETLTCILAYVEENMGYDLICDEYDADLRLIFLDHKRVCMLVDRDDIFVTENAGTYSQMLAKLSSIGRGIMTFTDIYEEWESPKGPINLFFRYRNQKYKIKIKYYGETPLFSTVYVLNQIIADSGYQYYIYAADEMDIWDGVTFLLDEQELEKVIKNRGWKVYQEEDFAKEEEAFKRKYIKNGGKV